ncbi:glutamate decarboxylase [Tanacetum coccineum]
MQVATTQTKAITGLAFTRKLHAKRKSVWKTYDRPNIVTGSNLQDCWEKFARYFEVDLKECFLVLVIYQKNSGTKLGMKLVAGCVDFQPINLGDFTLGVLNWMVNIGVEGPLLLKTNNTTISTKMAVSPRADKPVATLDEIMAALKSGQCAIVDIMTRIPLFSKSVQASRTLNRETSHLQLRLLKMCIKDKKNKVNGVIHRQKRRKSMGLGVVKKSMGLGAAQPSRRPKAMLQDGAFLRKLFG